MPKKFVNEILDEGLKKNCCIDIKYMKVWYNSLCRSKNYKTVGKRIFNEEKCEYDHYEVRNEDYEEAPPLIRYALKKSYEDMCMSHAGYGGRWTAEREEKLFFMYVDRKTVFDYLKIIPFTESVMINISPDWKGRKITCEMINHMHKIIQGYLAEGRRYDKYKYVLECGADGDHPHALDYPWRILRQFLIQLH